jgi:hypothetical protein
MFRLYMFIALSLIFSFIKNKYQIALHFSILQPINFSLIVARKRFCFLVFKMELLAEEY